MEPTLELEQHVQRALDGDRDALEAVLRGIQDRVYGLAVRMLGHPADAQDATQEILIKVVTNLAQFEGRSAFSTWVYRVAANYLLTTRKRRREETATTFEAFGEILDAGLALNAETSLDQPEQHVLVEEVCLSCTHGMLLCLDREHRLAFILGVVFDVSSAEGAEILAIAPDAYRQRLSRARRQLRDFMQHKCGLVNPAAVCRCAKQVAPSMAAGKLNPQHLAFATHSTITIADAREEIVELRTMAGVFRSHPAYRAPDAFVNAIKQVLQSPRLSILR